MNFSRFAYSVNNKYEILMKLVDFAQYFAKDFWE